MNQSPIKENDTVSTTVEAEGVPKGSYGAVVFKYTSQDLFEVEFLFSDKPSKVLTLTSAQITL